MDWTRHAMMQMVLVMVLVVLGATERLQMLVITVVEAAAAAGRKVEFLCNFGGKILPRPSDGMLGGKQRSLVLGETEVVID